MDAADLLLIQHAGLHSAAVSGAGSSTMADRALGGLDDAQMRLRPGKTMNSIAWIWWHIARVEDALVNLVVAARPQVLEDGWAGRLGGRRDIGTGMTSEEVGAFTERTEVAAIRAYREAVGRRTRELLPALPAGAWQGQVAAADMVRVVDAGALGPAAGWLAKAFEGRPRAAVLAGGAVGHNAQHLGEAITVRSEAGLGLGI